MLSPCIWQVTHALLTRPPLSINKICFVASYSTRQRRYSVRLACVKHAASVHPEPGSNSLVWIFPQNQLQLVLPFYCLFVCSHVLNFLFDTLWLGNCVSSPCILWIFRVALLFICQGTLCCFVCRNSDIISRVVTVVNTFLIFFAHVTFWRFMSFRDRQRL